MASTENADEKVPFRALQLINEHRNSYGLRYNDFARYRNHCRNKTHRLRSGTKMTHGKGKEFKKLPAVSLDNTKTGHLQLLLFEAERAWAYSQELYTASLDPSKKDDKNGSKLRHSATNRFRRSLHWSAQLFTLGQSLYATARLSASHMLELCAYTCLLSGRFLRYREAFDESLNMLSVSYTILATLADSARTSRDQALFAYFSDSIAPEIRYCAHQLGIKDAHDVDRIARGVAPKSEKTVIKDFDDLVRCAKEESGDDGAESRGRLRDMEWEGQKLSVRVPELVDVLLVVQKAEDQLKGSEKPKEGKAPGAAGKRQRKGIAAFDAILAALSDAEDVAKKLAEAQKTTSPSVSSKPGDQDIHFLHAFIVYQLLSRRIERDLTLISAIIDSSKKNPSKAMDASASQSRERDSEGETLDARVNPAVVKLLDTVLQSLMHMRSLSIVDESPDIANGIELRMAHARAQRCLFLSRSYAAVKQYAKAVLLIRRATTYIRESHSFLPSSFSPSSSPSSAPSSPHLAFYPLASTSFDSLSTQLTSDESRLKHAWFAYNGGAVSSSPFSTSSDPSAGEHKKPLHFDIALNYVQLDLATLFARAGLDASREVSASASTGLTAGASAGGGGQSGKTREDVIPRAETPQAASKGGLSSLLGGWWGRT